MKQQWDFHGKHIATYPKNSIVLFTLPVKQEGGVGTPGSGLRNTAVMTTLSLRPYYEK